MPIPLFNSIASWFLKKRFHQMELFLKYPQEVQTEVLTHLMTAAKDTEIGKRYAFGEIGAYETFSDRVPIVRYEDIEPMIERARMGENNIFWPTPIKWFAKSSGTTNAKSKFIPVSNESLEDCHFKAGKDMLSLYFNNNEESKLFSGKSLRLGGSKELYQDNNTFFGDLSAIIIDNMPFWAEMSSTPSNKVSLMSEWESKLAAIVEETIKEDVTSLAGVPSWMLVLLNEVLEKTGKNHLFEIWENLEVYFHGGVSFNPYREQYERLLPRKNFRYYEIYNASEGFFAIQDRNNSDELLLMLDYGIFYEFIPMELYGTPQEKVIPIWKVETNKNYAMLITTNAGLWRYLIGDTVRFTSTDPYRIKVTGRTKHHINVFGEELIIENAEEALQRACKETGAEIVDYTAGPIFMKGKKKGAHEWLIEFRKLPDDMEKFTIAMDEALKSLNSDYEAKRYNNITLNFPTLHIARKNLFYDWLKKYDKLGGQHKIPRLSSNRHYLEELLGMNG
ncbi:GH3 auxin-responsive promoter family protein [Galbibacter pacificus]|uniref:GH3 auxin-responsive promoter family protein n=1 Tax=Galbibacter pacificus TaxID=2996052 RepID=A0ABT6FT87_9FLAO|nr:GH3 auxin-responsive promoter family protein [Galbibacter pacificus]MDG3582417.1 GH3 auxin-responsive promoter family protein [Galbibacter pacificus]MDG3586465.1 GH3 auxin-responsive promoter family protein [Galbibacter pacificus]